MKTVKFVLLLALGLLTGFAHAAIIQVIITNAPGTGFYDPTPATPVGGNNGKTLGQQRLIAFEAAANYWGRQLNSDIPIRVQASFEALPCTADSAVLGAAGATYVNANFPNAPRQNTWYPSSLAEKLARSQLIDPSIPHIEAVFNATLGQNANCMPNGGFYLGLDNQHGNQPDLVTVLLHELAHGLGFQDFTDGETGEFLAGLPTIWDYFLQDGDSDRFWYEMSPPERVLSAASGGRLVWTGHEVYMDAHHVLSPGPRLMLSGLIPNDLAGDYRVGDADFGTPLRLAGLRGTVRRLKDQADGRGLACTPLSYLNSLIMRNALVVVDRGTCPFVTKALNVQNAGALGMIVVDNQAGPPGSMGGKDSRVTITSVRMARDDGIKLINLLAKRPPSFTLVNGTLNLDPSWLAGADRAGRVIMYSPLAYSPGSSVSHFTDTARRNLLMEPFLNDDLLHAVEAPYDLTKELLVDIGW